MHIGNKTIPHTTMKVKTNPTSFLCIWWGGLYRMVTLSSHVFYRIHAECQMIIITFPDQITTSLSSQSPAYKQNEQNSQVERFAIYFSKCFFLLCHCSVAYYYRVDIIIVSCQTIHAFVSLFVKIKTIAAIFECGQPEKAVACIEYNINNQEWHCSLSLIMHITQQKPILQSLVTPSRASNPRFTALEASMLTVTSQLRLYI